MSLPRGLKGRRGQCVGEGEGWEGVDARGRWGCVGKAWGGMCPAQLGSRIKAHSQPNPVARVWACSTRPGSDAPHQQPELS